MINDLPRLHGGDRDFERVGTGDRLHGGRNKKALTKGVRLFRDSGKKSGRGKAIPWHRHHRHCRPMTRRLAVDEPNCTHKSD